MNARHLSKLGLLLLLLNNSARAQGTKADYERADRLPLVVRDTVFRTRVRPHWFAGQTRFWYRVDLAGEQREFVVVDAAKGSRAPAFDHARLAEALTAASGSPVTADKLPVDAIEFVDNGAAVRFEAQGKYWRYEVAANKLSTSEKFTSPAAPQAFQPRRPRSSNTERSRRSPDGRWTVESRSNDLYLRPTNGEEVRLTRDGTASDGYESGVFWAPDSSRFVALRTRRGGDRRVTIVESSPRDQLQPKVHTYAYLKPGDSIPTSKPHLFEVATRREIPIKDELFSTPWSVDRFRWSPDSKRFTFTYNQRGHQALRIIAVDGQTGEAGALVNDLSKTFIDYAHKQFSYFADKTDELIWMSERDGWNHLYLIDSRTGHVKHSITRGEWIVRGVDWIDEAKRQIGLRVAGIYPEQDPYFIHHARVNFDGTGLVLLTAGNGTHEIEYSPDGKHIIDAYSRVDLPPVTELRRVDDGKLVCELQRGDWTKLLATGWKPPERFVAKARDGHTDIHGVIWRPTNFDAHRKYPVIEHIYAGPQGSFTPKRFSSYHAGQSLAELGFIVVQCDGMGTSHRSKAFHDVCCKNLGDAGFPDRIAWMKAAAAKYNYLDLSRVGVYGGSAGGQNALRALLAHGDFYKAAAADCGCHDNRMDKIWWNELWMGWPIGPHYAEQSNVTQAHKLQGKLLLTVGEVDRNVDPASTMQVVSALIRADKDFELVVVPGGGHGAGGSPYGRRRLRDFFVRNLLQVEPRRAG